MKNVRIDLMSYLFGDLLTVTQSELVWIYGGAIAVIGILAYRWNALLSLSIHEELAQVEGVPVMQTKLLLMGTIALVIAVAMKIVGILLITSLMIIPAATARRIANTPEKMAILASCIGCIAVALGIAASFYFDLPTGPAIVVSAAVLFLLVHLLPSP
jgi:zinc transport system permease protein